MLKSLAEGSIPSMISNPTKICTQTNSNDLTYPVLSSHSKFHHKMTNNPIPRPQARRVSEVKIPAGVLPPMPQQASATFLSISLLPKFPELQRQPSRRSHRLTKQPANHIFNTAQHVVDAQRRPAAQPQGARATRRAPEMGSAREAQGTFFPQTQTPQ